MVATRRLDNLVSKISSSAEFPDGGLLVALSGGADSAALAYLASRTEQPTRAIHVDHGTPHAPLLKGAAMDIAVTIGIDIQVVQVDLSGSPFSEARARKARYQALVASKEPGEWVLTGHTLEDQAETVLMSIIRGTGPVGLTGIPARTDQMVARPLLSSSRPDLREMAMLAGLSFVDDPSNRDVGFTRNAVRLEVMPDLESRFNPGLTQSLARLARLVSRDTDLLGAASSDLPTHIDENRAQIARSVLLTTPRPVADRALRRMVSTLRPPHGPTHDEMAAIWSVVNGERKQAELAGGLEVGLNDALFEIRTGDPGPTAPFRKPLGPGQHTFGGLILEVVESKTACRVFPLSPLAALFPADTSLHAVSDGSGRVVVEVDGEVAWVPGGKRFPIAFYDPGATGYLSVFATEENGWT